MRISPQVAQGWRDLILTDGDLDLCEAGLLIGKMLRPSADLHFYRGKVQDWSLAVLGRYNALPLDLPRVERQARALRQILCDDHHLMGDDDVYGDLGHMNPLTVLDSGAGETLVLALIYLAVCQKCAWSAEALNFPGYCLIRLQDGADRIILDPYHKAEQLDAHRMRMLLKVIGGTDVELSPQYYEGITSTHFLVQHLTGLKMFFLRAQRVEQALETVECLTLLVDDSAAFWRERGLLEARMDDRDAAITSLQKALLETRDADARRHTQQILDNIEHNWRGPTQR